MIRDYKDVLINTIAESNEVNREYQIYFIYDGYNYTVNIYKSNGTGTYTEVAGDVFSYGAFHTHPFVPERWMRFNDSINYNYPNLKKFIDDKFNIDYKINVYFPSWGDYIDGFTFQEYTSYVSHLFNTGSVDRYVGVLGEGVKNYSGTGKYYIYYLKSTELPEAKQWIYNLYREYLGYVNENDSNDYSIINYIGGTVTFLNKYGKTILISEL